MRSTVLLTGLLLSIGSITDGGQDSPAAVAEQEARERYQRMTAKIEDLETTLQKHQQKIIEIEILLRGVRDDISRLKDSGQNSSTRDAIERLDKKVDAIDRQRLAEQETVTKELTRLRKDLLGTVAPKTSSGKQRNSDSNSGTASPPTIAEKGFEYEIKEGDYLVKIVKTLNKMGKNVTEKQLVDANPGIKWERLRIGQKIFIPAQ